MSFRFCPLCGAALGASQRGGRLRPTCPNCDFIHYGNPTAGVAVVVRNDAAILLGRRAASASYAGHWCIPCGHVEGDEDVRAAAVREFAEETGLVVTLGEVIAVHSNFHNPHQPTVGIWFDGTVQGGALRAADDLDRVAYWPLDALPEPLAFPTDRLVLDQLRNDTL